MKGLWVKGGEGGVRGTQVHYLLALHPISHSLAITHPHNDRYVEGLTTWE